MAAEIFKSDKLKSPRSWKQMSDKSSMGSSVVDKCFSRRISTVLWNPWCETAAQQLPSGSTSCESWRKASKSSVNSHSLKQLSGDASRGKSVNSKISLKWFWKAPERSWESVAWLGIWDVGADILLDGLSNKAESLVDWGKHGAG